MQTTSKKEESARLKRSEALKLIDRTFKRLDRACEGAKEWPQLLKLVREEERQHRNGYSFGVPNALPFGAAVQSFAIKAVFDRLVIGPEHSKIFTPHAKDYFWIKPSIFGGTAIAAMQREEILKEFSRSEMRAYLSVINYSRLNDPQQP